MTDHNAPASTPPASAHETLRTLEAAARREVAQLSDALPAPVVTTDPLFAHLAWDLGLTGDAAQR